jgi:hypothetical protein
MRHLCLIMLYKFAIMTGKCLTLIGICRGYIVNACTYRESSTPIAQSWPGTMHNEFAMYSGTDGWTYIQMDVAFWPA